MVISVIAFTGVVMASVYALRVFIRTMHNRTGPRVQSREISVREGLALVPFLLAIALFAVYPQIQLGRSEKSVTASIVHEQALTGSTSNTLASVMRK
jgi:NADH-quinone oxidoreductase subunit M